SIKQRRRQRGILWHVSRSARPYTPQTDSPSRGWRNESMKRTRTAVGILLGLSLCAAPGSEAVAQIAVYGPAPVYEQSAPAYGQAPVYSRSAGAQGRRVGRQMGAEGRNVGRQMGAQGRSVGRPINTLTPSVGR